MAAQSVRTGAMTIRVYKIRDGEITEDSGVRSIEPMKALEDRPLGYPPCDCPGHRKPRDLLFGGEA